MDFKYKLKSIAEHIPYSLGKWTSRVPYRLRLGSQYTESCRLASHYAQAGPEERRAYAVRHLNRIVQYAQKNIPFYQDLYGRSPIAVNSIRDFEQLPIITKTQVREYSKQSAGATLINTGGSSGEPLSFYIDKNAWAREWAHMHYIWGLRGYLHTQLMITILGRNLGKDLYKYNAVHNEIRVNPYLDAGARASDIVNLITEYPVMYIQGYPSSIYNLLREIEPQLGERDRALVSSRIKCCFLSSEYPIPYMTKYLHDTWNLDYISWYGHSEMCVLAYDNDRDGKYTPFITYGYAEDVGGMLCGTSYHNHDMPLIRYSTGDIIESKADDSGIMEHFSIKEGREGDFIEDKCGKRLPLTALIYGRHHRIFNVADYVQLFQPGRGAATLYVTARESVGLPPSDLSRYFDWSDVNLDVNYVILQKPIRTKRGKLKLKLLSDDLVDANQ